MFSKQEGLQIMQLWQKWGDFLTEVLMRQLKNYERDLVRKNTEWENAEQLVSYLARKQTLIDLKNILERRYE